MGGTARHADSMTATGRVTALANGVMTLSGPLFDGYGSAVLLPGSREDLATSMRIHLALLRDLPAFWSTLESIEIRGHADPRATREP